MQVGVAKYIAGLVSVPTGVKTLADLITFNIQHASEELIPPYYADQSMSVWFLSVQLQTTKTVPTGIPDS
jgi:amidase